MAVNGGSNHSYKSLIGGPSLIDAGAVVAGEHRELDGRVGPVVESAAPIVTARRWSSCTNAPRRACHLCSNKA